MPETFKKLKCKSCESGFERTYQILMDMLPKLMRIQTFYWKLCETNFAKGHLMKGHADYFSSCEEKEFYLNHVKLVLQHPVRWKFMRWQRILLQILETAFGTTYHQMKVHFSFAHDRRNANPVCKGLFRVIYRFLVWHMWE